MNEDLEDIIKRRNKRLKEFWDKTEISVRIIGNKNTPAIIFDNRKILSCYVRNFDLIFLDKNDGNEVLRIKLTEIPQDVNDTIFLEWFSDCEHKDCYSIRLIGTQLRLCGYNFVKDDNGVISFKYPVFSEHDFKLYFSKQVVEDIIETYNSETLNLELI